MTKYVLLLAASLALGCAANAPPTPVTSPAPETHHHAWWLGLQASRTAFEIGPSLSARCPEAVSDHAAGSEAWWRSVIAGLVACEQKGALEHFDVVVRAHLLDAPAPPIRRYVRDLSGTIGLALEASAADTVVRDAFAIAPDRALRHRVAVELALEPAH